MNGGAVGEVGEVGEVGGAAGGFAERTGSLRAGRVPPEDGGTFAGTQEPSAVRCAGT